MLNKFDLFYENFITEGRKSYDSKKFKLNIEKIRDIVDSLEDSHEDKGHFKSIVSKLKERDFHTPKTFKEDVIRIFNSLKKKELAKGYADVFFDFLKNQEDSPFDDVSSKSGDDETSEPEGDYIPLGDEDDRNPFNEPEEEFEEIADEETSA
jgi:hypothetical protein